MQVCKGTQRCWQPLAQQSAVMKSTQKTDLSYIMVVSQINLIYQ